MPGINHPIVGRVEYQVGKKGALILDSAWVRGNVGVVEVPELKGVPTFGGAFSGRVMFYKRAGVQLQAAFRVIRKLGLLSRVIFWAGSFVPRFKRGSTTSPSNHTFATAFDINHQQNPFRKPIAPKGAYGSVVELLPVFRAFGFECGADWRPENCDGMHFEIERILSAAEIAAVEARLTGEGPQFAAKPLPRELALFDGDVVRSVRELNVVKNRNFAPVTEVLAALGLDYAPDGERSSEARLVLKVWEKAK